MFCPKCKKEIMDDSNFCMYCGRNIKGGRGQKSKQRGNGQGSVYKLPNGKWRAVVTLGYEMVDGKSKPIQRSRSDFLTKKAALDYLPNLKNRTKKEKITLASIWDGWSTSAMEKLSASKQSHYKTAYAKISEIAYLDVTILTINDLQKVIDENAPTYYPARDIKVLLSHLFKRAMAQQDVQTNLAEFIVLPDLDEGERMPFSEQELKSLWNDYGAGNKLTGYILFMIYSGMMPGELFKAKKDMIDWDNQCIIGCGLKTKKRKGAPIMIADMMMPVLKDLCEFSTSNKLITMYRDTFYKEFDKTLRRCECRDLTPYSCRHTTATALALGNIAPSIIQEVMRHTKFSTTQKYIHVDTGPMLSAVNNILESQK